MTLPEPKRVKLGDLTIAFRDVGRGPAVVFLHGLGGASGIWTDQFEKLSTRYRIIAWDAPGYGGSTDIPDSRVSIAHYVAVLTGLLDHLKIARVHLVGHSLGAIIAAAFRRKHPLRVLSVTLAQPMIGLGRLPPEMQDQAFRARKNELETLGPKGFAARRIPASVSSAAPTELVARAIETGAKTRTAGYLAGWHALCGADIFQEIKGLNIASIVIAGTDDSVAPRESCRQVAEAIREAEFVVFQGVGHSIYLEAPERLTEVLDEFLTRAQKAAKDLPGGPVEFKPYQPVVSPPVKKPAEVAPAAPPAAAKGKSGAKPAATPVKPAAEKTPPAKSEPVKAGADKKGAAKPEAKKAEPKTIEAKKPAATKPEAKKPEAKKPEAKKPEPKKPEAKKPAGPPPLKRAAAKGVAKPQAKAVPKAPTARPTRKPAAKAAPSKAKPGGARKPAVKPAAKASSRRAAPSSSRPKAGSRR